MTKEELNLMEQKKNKGLDFNEIDGRLAAGWYVYIGQRKKIFKRNNNCYHCLKSDENLGNIKNEIYGSQLGNL